MTVALLSIGTEILRGEVVDTNASWLAAHLTEMGFTVGVSETVADEREAIETALRRLSDTHALLVATGGLGPTSDDLTAEALAAVAGVALRRDETVLAAIRKRLEERGRALNASDEKQALVPEGVETLPNAAGTAPGLWWRHARGSAFFLPGVPHEMERIFTDQVAPRVRAQAPADRFLVKLHTYGAAESRIAEVLGGLETAHTHVTLGYRAHGAEVEVKIFGHGNGYADARERAEAAAQDARRRLGDLVYAEGDDTLPQVVARAIRSRGWRLAAAESCTGGLLASILTRLPASDYFVGAAVTYANMAKTRSLGVSEDAMRGHGAVSAEVCAEMAEGARRTFGAEVAVAVTGIAGPTGATAQKPLGLCFWAVAHPGATVVEQAVFGGDRTQVQLRAAYAALDLLRRLVPTAPDPTRDQLPRIGCGDELSGPG
jgi:nicotinamide-nucleotide amidase